MVKQCLDTILRGKEATDTILCWLATAHNNRDYGRMHKA